jgi:hypothetical protein
MATLAFIVFLVALGFARALRRRHLANLTVEQKAAVMQALYADAVWPFALLIVLIVFPLRAPFSALSSDPRIQGGIALFAAVFLVSVAVSITYHVRLRRLALPREYLRSSIAGAFAVHLMLLVTMALGIGLVLSYASAAVTPTPNQTVERTATRLVSTRRVATMSSMFSMLAPGRRRSPCSR